VPLEFHVAESAERAISYLNSLLNFSDKHEPRWVDLILLDIGLPDESGLAVLKFIRQNPKLRSIPVIILTGLMDPAMHKEAYDLGANALHEKPANFQDTVDLANALYSHWANAMRPTH
jgi:CheY-like chemotaxis protein